MFPMRWVTASIALSLLASCAAAPLPPVAVIATRPDALALAGSWEGEYSSAVTRRSGTIQFFLSADPDSASGEVIMFPSRIPRPTNGNAHGTTLEQEPRHLMIRLVMAAGDSVIGVLSPYEDYDGSALLTRFVGVVRDDTMQGQYVTENVRTREITDGEWNLRRRNPRP